MTVSSLLIEVAGWGGAVLILGAYILVSSGKVAPRSCLFQWMNVVGSIGFIINSGYKGAWPSVALNIVWVAVGILTLQQMRAR